MFLMYIDESGDVGLPSENSPTRYFVLSGLVVHELRWQQSLDHLIAFRRRMQASFRLRVRDEIHTAQMINRPGPLVYISRNNRLTIMRHFTDEVARLPDANIINVVVDKSTKANPYDVFTMAWKTLIQRFHNTISHRNFRGPANPDERGIILPDHTDDKKLTQLLRQMRRYNPIPNQPNIGLGYRDLSIDMIIEDPNFRDSGHSYFIQAVDLVAYLLQQKLQPNSYIRRKSAQNYFDRLTPALCTVASSSDSQGIVRL